MSELVHSNNRPDAKKRECLKAYVDSGEACWENVVKAVDNHPLMNGRLASEIKKKYILKDKL